MYRVERIPRNLREFARGNKIPLKNKGEGYRFTGKEEWIEEQQSLMENNHPLYELSLLKQKQQIISTPLAPYMIATSIPEKLEVESYEIGLTDGTGKKLFQDIVYMAKRDNGEMIELDAYWLFSNGFESVLNYSSCKQQFVHDICTRTIDEKPGRISASVRWSIK